MNCMKCGRDLEPGQVFCESCLAEMEKYPVKPGTVVQLPRRREEMSSKKPTRRRSPPTPEERIKTLRRRVRVLSGLLLITLGLVALLAYPWLKDLLSEDHFLPGQNYSSVSTPEADVSRETLPESGG